MGVNLNQGIEFNLEVMVNFIVNGVATGPIFERESYQLPDGVLGTSGPGATECSCLPCLPDPPVHGYALSKPYYTHLYLSYDTVHDTIAVMQPYGGEHARRVIQLHMGGRGSRVQLD